VIHEPLAQLAQRVRMWAEQAPSVRALFWYGGYGYGQAGQGSDLDLAVLLRSGAELSRVAEELVDTVAAVGGPVAYSIIDAQERRLTAWTRGDLTKLDAVFARTVEELSWLADAQDVPPPRLTPAWPVREPELVELLQRASQPLPTADTGRWRERGEREIDRFLIAFEACSVACVKSDAYTFYFQYSLALGRLARLIQLMRVGHRYLYVPRHFFTQALAPDERKGFHPLAGTLQLSEADERKRALAGAFLKAVEEAREVLGVRQEASVLGTFLEHIQRRDGTHAKGGA
jgi:hypothetical protein